jgi:hypothetical protein
MQKLLSFPAVLLLALPALADEVNISAGAVRGADEAACRGAVGTLATRAAAMSSASAHPNDLVAGLRSFYDATYRLNPRGETRVRGQLSRVYVSGHFPNGQPREEVQETSFSMEVLRPLDGVSPISGTWNWLERTMEEVDLGNGRPVARPLMHEFAWSGRMQAENGGFGHAVSPCRPSDGGGWFGAVFVWTYRAE